MNPLKKYTFYTYEKTIHWEFINANGDEDFDYTIDLMEDMKDHTKGWLDLCDYLVADSDYGIPDSFKSAVKYFNLIKQILRKIYK